MGLVLCWVCPSCSTLVPVDGRSCPKCGHLAPSTPPPSLSSAALPKQRIPSWTKAVSVPTAIIGIVGFFLPWFQVSCGPVRLQFSGYEFATGKWEEKMRPDSSQEFWDEFNKGASKGLTKRGTARGGAGPIRRPTNEVQPQVPANRPVPLLWIVPIACACLLLMGLFGAPKIPTVLVSLAGSAYLSYFAIEASRSGSDPRNTGGLLEYSWLIGFWMAWLGLVAPAVVALARPSRR